MTRIPRLLIWAAICLLVVAFLFAPGTTGPLLLDDAPNLASAQRYLEGELSARDAAFNTSGPMGRPLSAGSFLIDAKLHGLSVPGLKWIGLVMHGLAALLATFLLWLILRARESQEGVAAPAWLALVAALVWAALPIQVSTALYVVQRMTTMATIFVLLALICYVKGRVALGRGRMRIAVGWLFALYPLMQVLGLLSKENAVVAPLLVAALELTLLGGLPMRGPNGPRILGAFFACALLLPAMALIGAGVLGYLDLASGYETRAFSMSERVASAPLILAEYLAATVIPWSGLLGLFHDNHALSSSLTQPWPTALAHAVLAMLTMFAWFVRRRLPWLALALMWFPAAHLLEAGPFALEPYFEHRNHLPSLAMAFALVGGILALIRRDAFPAVRVLLLGLLTAYSATTLMRATLWGDASRLLQAELDRNPGSPRLQADLALSALARGEIEAAKLHASELSRIDPREMPGAALVSVLSSCATTETLRMPIAQDVRPIRILEANLTRQLVGMVENRHCPALPMDSLIGYLDARLASADRSGGDTPRLVVELELYKLLLTQAQFDRAEPLGREIMAREPDHPAVLTLRCQHLLLTGRTDEAAAAARHALAQARPLTRGYRQVLEVCASAPDRRTPGG